ncbi:MAG: glucose-6-phosphate dehydrogenase [Chloroflexi bacterium]|nr:glucose-6-phosphate dehydrogenase [Chloroflexota bacterium]
MLTDEKSKVIPLRVGMTTHRVPDPGVLVIFGATGDLTHRKLMPALFDLFCDGKLPQGFSVVGFARREKSNEQFRGEMRAAADEFARNKPGDSDRWDEFSQGLYYHRAEFHESQGYASLGELLKQIDAARGTRGNRLFYLATAPEYYALIVQQLGAADLCKSSGWTRVIVEKPFGRDLASAHELNMQLLPTFNEPQIYRIDHYLGKETVQNVMAFRFGNTIFEPIWNRNYIDHVQITAAESVGVEDRGGYYDKAGALRDMVQSHLLQLVSLTAMEPPVSFDSNAVHDEKVKVLRAIRPFTPERIERDIVRGQYGRGKSMLGYREEPRVDPNSSTETYVALKLNIDNWRWAGVPFCVRTGKRLQKRFTEIAIQFRAVPHPLFAREALQTVNPNALALRIQPDEGIHLRFAAKRPGQTTELREVKMDFYYKTAFGSAPGEAYETLLIDAMRGDSTLFNRKDEVEIAWSLITPVLEYWANAPAPNFPNYAAGAWGPEAADTFLQSEGREWRAA